MLERTAGCLEQGSLRRLWPLSQKSLKCRRNLHSAFWNHGGGDIELSPLWAAMIQAVESSAQLPDKQQTKPSGQNGLLLDFLYPAGTINFIRKYAGPNNERQAGRRAGFSLGKLGYRLYTSSAKNSDDSIVREAEDSLSDGLGSMSNGREVDRERLRVLMQTSTRPVYEEVWHYFIVLPVSDREILRSQVLRYLSTSDRIIDAERSTELFENPNYKHKDDVTYSCAVSAYLQLRNYPRALEIYKEVITTGSVDRPAGASELLAYFLEQSSWSDAYEIWESCNNFRSTIGDGVYYDMWDSCRKLKHLEALALALSQYVDYLNGKPLLTGREKHLLKASRSSEEDVSHQETPNVANLSDAILPTMNSKSGQVYDPAGNAVSLRGLPQDMVAPAGTKDTPEHSSDLDSLMNEAIETTANDPDHAESLKAVLPNNDAIKLFASEFIKKALIFSQIENPHTFSSLLDKLDEWALSTPEFYEETLYHTLEQGQNKLAVQCYRRGREFEGAKFAMTTLYSILATFCEFHSVKGIQEVLNDWFRWYDGPSKETYRICMVEFARQGDAPTVHALFHQFSIRFKDTGFLSANEVVPLLQVHARRGELSEVIKIFDQIVDVYGLRPTTTCWNVLLHAYGRVRDFVGAFECFERVLLSEDVTADSYTFGTIMAIAAAAHDREKVTELYELAEAQGITFDCSMVRNLVLVHCQDDMVAEAEEICLRAMSMGLKGSYTSMWNHVLFAYAMRRDTENVYRILKKMSDLKLRFDGRTYEALLQALGMVRQGQRAFEILKEVMPAAGVTPTSSHYAIVMGAFLAARHAPMVFKVHEHMLYNGLAETASVRLLTLKGTVLHSTLKPEEKTLQDALDLFYTLMDEMTPQEWSSTSSQKGRSGMPLNIAFPAAFHRYMMFVLSNCREYETADQLYEQFTKLLPGDQRAPLPIISAYMLTQLGHGDHEGVEKSWERAVSYAQASGSGVPVPGDAKEPRRIVPSRKMDLDRALTTYMNSLFEQKRIDDITFLVKDVEKLGFELTNGNWNQYVEFLARAFRFKSAFKVCETMLMPNWAGWNALLTAPVRSRLPVEIRMARTSKRFLYPKHRTVLHLAKAYMELEANLGASPAAELLMRDITRDFPKTIHAIKTMERTDSLAERLILRDF